MGKAVKYREYLTSKDWYGKHKAWLQKAEYRCAFFPWIKVGRGNKYNCHHTNYQQLGEEVYWRDILVLSPFAHKHIIHGLLSGYKRPSQQKVYPNKAQRVAHLWCRLPPALKYLSMANVLLGAFLCLAWILG